PRAHVDHRHRTGELTAHRALDGGDEVDVDGERDVSARHGLDPTRLLEVLRLERLDVLAAQIAAQTAQDLLHPALPTQVALPASLDTHRTDAVARAIPAPFEARERLRVHLAHVAEEVRRELAVGVVAHGSRRDFDARGLVRLEPSHHVAVDVVLEEELLFGAALLLPWLSRREGL